MSDLSERHKAHLRAAGMTGMDPEDLPEHPQSAWGEEDSDWSQEEHDYHNGTPGQRDQHGTGHPTVEETERYYDAVRRQNIRIVQDDE